MISIIEQKMEKYGAVFVLDDDVSTEMLMLELGSANYAYPHKIQEYTNHLPKNSSQETPIASYCFLNKKSPDFDNMEGHQFEVFCADLLKKNGYKGVSVTQGSRDQGVDIIAFRDGIKYGIQCKCYSCTVGNEAVQEVYAGIAYHRCNKGIVLTNNYFTSSAISLAQRVGVILWDRDALIKLLHT